MKYLVCGLDSDSYTSPDFKIVDTYEEARQTALEWCLEFDANGEFTHIQLDRIVIESCEGSFYVTEIKEINTNDHILVWHHAYEGVDFEIRCQGTCKECLEKQIKDIKTIQEEWSEFSLYNENFDIKKDDVVDTGNEWEMWNILEVK